MRVFLDTNVIVSAVTTRGLCADVFRTVLAEHELITSLRVLQEVRRILKVKFDVPEEVILEYLELIEQDAVVAEFKDLPSLPIKDKDDIEIVAAAVSASAHVLVTGDREVQKIKSIKNVRVMSPRAFWEELTANQAL
jgi:putative PIN family toxin of toxin-antitoxin system